MWSKLSQYAYNLRYQEAPNTAFEYFANTSQLSTMSSYGSGGCYGIRMWKVEGLKFANGTNESCEPCNRFLKGMFRKIPNLVKNTFSKKGQRAFVPQRTGSFYT